MCAIICSIVRYLFINLSEVFIIGFWIFIIKFYPKNIIISVFFSWWVFNKITYIRNIIVIFTDIKFNSIVSEDILKIKRYQINDIVCDDIDSIKKLLNKNIDNLYPIFKNNESKEIRLN